MNPIGTVTSHSPRKASLRGPLKPNDGSTQQKGKATVARVASIRSRKNKAPNVKAVLVPAIKPEQNTFGPLKGSK